MNTPLYDTIGKGYRAQRKADPRIAASILRALGDARSVVNVGAGAGSYEPADREVVAVEPSMTMLRQRRQDASPVIQGIAEDLPMRTRCVDAAMAVLTVHHWHDAARGLQELRRVARDRIVVLTYDPSSSGFWLTNEYFPHIADQDRRLFPAIDAIRSQLGQASVLPVPVPKDCVDGFLGAFWARPQAYLDPAVRSGMSAFANLPGLDEGLLRLRRDLENGRWGERFGPSPMATELDIGYRLVVATAG